MRGRLGLTGVLVLLIGLLALPSLAAGKAKLQADYRFENSFKSAVSGVPRLDPVGPPRMCPPCAKFKKTKVRGKRQGVWKWPARDGLRLRRSTKATGGSKGTYTIAMLVKLNAVDGYRKLVDFSDLVEDEGLYDDDGELDAYDLGGDSDVVLRARRWHQIVWSRNSSGRVKGFVDGTLEVTALDPDEYQVAGDANVLHFLVDDAFGSESTGGMIARMRIFDDALKSKRIKALGA